MIAREKAILTNCGEGVLWFRDRSNVPVSKLWNDYVEVVADWYVEKFCDVLHWSE